MLDAKVGTKALDLDGGVHGTGARLDNDEHQVDPLGGAPAQVLDACCHVHDDDLVPLEHQVAHQRLEEGALGAEAAPSTGGYRAQGQQGGAVGTLHAVVLQYVLHLGVEAEHLPVALPGSDTNPVLDKVVVAGQGLPLGPPLDLDAQGGGQVRGGVAVHQDGGTALPSPETANEAGGGGLSHAALACHRYAPCHCRSPSLLQDDLVGEQVGELDPGPLYEGLLPDDVEHADPVLLDLHPDHVVHDMLPIFPHLEEHLGLAHGSASRVNPPRAI